MQLTSQQLSVNVGVTPRYIRSLTKKSIQNNNLVINIKGESFTFSQIKGVGGRGWVYVYEAIKVPKIAQKPKRKVKNLSVVNPADLPRIRCLKSFTADEKLALIGFYNGSQINLGVIVKALILEHRSDTKPASLQARVKRWIKIFKEKGRVGLEDKRGGKAFKSDLKLVEMAILGAGSVHDTTLYVFYCYLYAQKHNLIANLRKPTSDISESAFNRAVKHLIKTKPLLKEYLHLGMDAFIYAEPSFGREWEYPNQQWEVDATPMDLMIKVAVNKDGVRDYASRDINSDYHLVRAQIIRVIDNFSKASVLGLYESSNSYANARLLHKAFAKLGMPEIIKGDNGGDYVSEHLQGVIADLKIEYIATGKARGDEKGTIERSFRTLQHSAQFESLPGFVGHNVHQRQHLENEASTKLEKLSGVATNIKGEFMWHWQAENWLENYLLNTDADKYSKHGDTQLNETELADIYRLLGKRTIKKVSKEGIRHRNTHFLSYEMWEKVTIGDQVEIRENIDNSTKLFLFQDGKYLGELGDKNIFQKTQTVEELKAVKKAYKQRVVKEVKSLTKQSQKQFKGLQNKMRDEFLDTEVKDLKIKQDLTDEAQKEDGFDAHASYLALVAKQA